MRQLTLDEVRAIRLTEEETDSWHPIAHSQIIDQLHAGIHRAEARVVGQEYYAYGETAAVLYGFIHTDSPLDDKTRLSMMFRTSNNRSVAFQLSACARVLGFPHLLAHGESSHFQRRHTASFDFMREMRVMSDLVFTYGSRLARSIYGLKSQQALGSTVHRLFFEVFRNRVLPLTRYMALEEELEVSFAHFGQTMWGLYNAFGRVTWEMTPEPRYHALRALGEMFTVYEL